MIKETGRFLRASELTGDGLEDQFYHWTDEGLTPASRASLIIEGSEPALSGTWSTTLSDGTEVELTTVWGHDARPPVGLQPRGGFGDVRGAPRGHPQPGP
ncbi:MAG: hypothetical protein M5U19_08850 [Microthrixaceae bacterium]|nr:hypothetical protein [Microthrixaceae bacterium]